MDPNNDADMLTLELNSAAQDAANGVCSLCDDMLDPMNPKWDAHDFRGITREEYALMVGPVHPGLPYHTLCLEDRHAI